MTGVITIAIGEKRYINMAKMLALSLQQNAPGIKTAVVTDARETDFKGLFDIYIPYNKAYGHGFSQKLHLDKYTPFDETIFIDADCLVTHSLEYTKAFCAMHPFVVFGAPVNSGEWFMDVAAICKKFNVPSIPQFNGGLYYFKNSLIATAIFNTTRKLMQPYTETGFLPFKGEIADEPLIAVAMAINNVNAIDDEGKCMRTPIGIIGSLNIDVLKQQCHFNKEGKQVNPAVMHFPGSYTDAFHYKREVVKLKLAYALPFISKNIICCMVNAVFNSWYATLVYGKRIIKYVIRGQQFDFKTALPIFSNQ
jgi:hypothetical protein